MSSTQPHFDDAARAWTLPAEKVDCDVNGEIVQIPVTELECTVGGHETDDEWCSWIEYRRAGEAGHLHRSVRLHLKKPVLADGFSANFS